MKVIVLGAGIIGTSSAWFLNKAGHDVIVIDRQPGAAQETSFANGCQISVSHAEPWANPAAPLKILKWLGKEDAPLLYRFRPEWLQWRWGLQFLRECTPARTAANIRQIVAIAEYSRQSLLALRAETGIEYDHLNQGILHFYTDPKEFEHSQKMARLMCELGCARQSLDADAVVRIEPALAPHRQQIVGGDFTESDESGDVHLFTKQLAHRAAATGVDFRFNTTITRLIAEGSGSSTRIVGVETINSVGQHEVLRADAFVLALGSFSVALARPLGIDLLVYPGKGYSATYPVTSAETAPSVSLTDDEHKLVVSRLGSRLRVAGTCELNGYDRSLNPVRCEALTQRMRFLFPEACDYDSPLYWTGLRPLTPSNVPYIGQSRIGNLFLNTGHGTLGWTMGCGSGQAIAELISGRRPEVDFSFTGISANRSTSTVTPNPLKG